MPKPEINLAGDLLDSFRSVLRPQSEMEALMMAKPHEEIDDSFEQTMLAREAVYEAIEMLPPRDRMIVELVTYEAISLSQLGKVLGCTKTHAFRLRNFAYDKLKQALQMNAHIRRKYPMASTWDQSATQWCTFLASLATERTPMDYNEVRDRIDALISTTFNNDQEPSQSMFIAVAKPTIQYLRKLNRWDSAEMAKLLAFKQHDYGHKNIDRFGLKGIIVRLNDKYERLANLEFTRRFAGKGNTVIPKVNESKVDTLLDIVGYCVIGLMVLDDTFKLELGEAYDTSTSDNSGI